MITEYGTDVPSLAIVRSARGWARMLHRYVVDHGGAVVKTRPLEERQALEDDYDILIVDDISSFLNAHIVEELHRSGRRVLGVWDPEEFSPSGDTIAGRKRLEQLGVDATISADTTPEDFVRIIQQIAPVRKPALDPLPDFDEFFSPFGPPAPEKTAPSFNVVSPAKPINADRRKGHVTAVFGASGGSGVTEVAIELARALGRRGERTVLVDADEMAPSLAQRLSLSLHPNLRTAVDVVEHGTGRIPDTLTTIATGLEVLVGLPHPRDWVEVRGSDLTAVVGELSRGRGQIVVNASPFIEDLAPFGADRFGVSRAVIAGADDVIVVCPPTPVGIARLIDRAAELSELAAGKPLHVVVNRNQSGKFKQKEILAEIGRSFNATTVTFLPADTKVEKASWDGTLVAAGEFTKAVDSEVAVLIPAVAFKKSERSGRAAQSKKGA